MVIAVILVALLGSGIVMFSDDSDAADTSDLSITHVTYFDGRTDLTVPGISDQYSPQDIYVYIESDDYTGTPTYIGMPTSLTDVVRINNVDLTGEVSVYIREKGESVDYIDMTSFNVATVTFDANGGSGNMSSVDVYGTYTLPECTFDAPEGTSFAGWSLENNGDAIDGSTVEITVDTTLYAVWEQTGGAEDITVKFDAENGTVSPESVTVPAGSTVTAVNGESITIGKETVTSYKGDDASFTYEFVGWFIGDNKVTVGTAVAGGDTITARYKATPVESDRWTITVSAGPNGTVDPLGELTVIDGENLTITFTPNGGYKVSEILVNDEPVVFEVGTDGRVTYILRDVSADTSVSASFEPILVTGIEIDNTTLSLKEGEKGSLSVTVTPEDALNRSVSWASSDNGVVTVDQDGNVTAVGVGTATITVTAKDGSGVSAECEVTVTAADVPSYGVTVGTTEGEGTVTVSQGSVPQGGVVSYTVSPAYGWIVQSVKVNDVDQEIAGATGFTGRYTVTSDVTIDVVFVEDTQHQAIVTAGDHGSIGAGGATSAPVIVYGHWATTVTIDPDNGYRVSKITPDQDASSISYEDGVLTIAAGSDVTKIDIVFEQIPVSDDDEYVPPDITVVTGDDDDSTTYIVAIAAGVVVAILAALILMQTRKS